MLIRLPSPDVGNILIAGDQGAGKTTLLWSIVLSLSWANDSQEVALVVLGDGLSGVEHLGLRQRVLRVDGWGDVLTAGAQAAGMPVVFVADDVYMRGGTGRVIEGLESLLRSRHHHYVLAWDGTPPVEIAGLFPARLVGRMNNSEDALVATGRSRTGAERLKGRGDFLAVAEGRVTRFQAAHVSPQEIREVALPSLTARLN